MLTRLISAAAAVALAGPALLATPVHVGAPKTALKGGTFIAVCKYSHTANDDPIMFPGQPGVAMLHDFFANRSTNAGSTYDSLHAAPATSCISPADSAAYWTPALYSNGVQILPNQILAYYDAISPSTAPRLANIPAGLEMIAGDETATAPQDIKRVSWMCAARKKGQVPLGPYTSPPACPLNMDFSLHIRFPQCWDGVTLSGAMQTNVVFAATNQICPADHPVLLPELLLDITYPVYGGVITLSTGPGTTGSPYTAHADFINAWNQPILDGLVHVCDVLYHWCGVIGPDNKPTH